MDRKQQELDLYLGKVKASKTSDSNKRVIREYLRHHSAKGSAVRTKAFYLRALLRLLEYVDKDFKKISLKDFERFQAKLKSSPKFSSVTVRHINASLKSFFKWLYGGTEPDVTKWVKVNKAKDKRKLPEDLLTMEDIKSLIEVCNNVHERAMISVAYESAARPEEFLKLRIKDVNFDKYGATIRVDGKTGMRRIRLIDSANYLQQWIENHPDKNNPDRSLWVRLFSTSIIPYSPRFVEHILRRIKRRTKIRKPVYQYLFRHSRLTELAKHLTEQELKVFAGWKQDSSMAATYVHLSGADIDNKLLAINGVREVEEKIKSNPLKPKPCPRCKEKNSSTSKFCSKCSMVLDINTAMELQETKQKDDSTVKTMVERMTQMQQQMQGLFQEIDEMRKQKALVKAR